MAGRLYCCLGNGVNNESTESQKVESLLRWLWINAGIYYRPFRPERMLAAAAAAAGRGVGVFFPRSTRRNDFV